MASTLNIIAANNNGVDKVMACSDAYRLILQFAGTKSNKRKRKEFLGEKKKRVHHFSAYNMWKRTDAAKLLEGEEMKNEWTRIKNSPMDIALYDRLANEENELVKYETETTTKMRRKRFAIKNTSDRMFVLESEYKIVGQLEASKFLFWKNAEAYGWHAVPYRTSDELKLTRAEKMMYIREKTKETDIKRQKWRIASLASWGSIAQQKLRNYGLF